MTRREAREAAFQLVYERSIQKDKSTSKIIKDTAEAQEFIPTRYIKAVLRGTEEKLNELDTLINEYSIEWRIERMSAVSLSILRLAVFEMLYLGEEVPFKVAINEAVELAKKYDHDKAPAFINGILNRIAIVKGLKEETEADRERFKALAETAKIDIESEAEKAAAILSLRDSEPKDAEDTNS